ncbi:MAG: hypothetical protein U0W24_01225 [Bacteroidales bacterium]
MGKLIIKIILFITVLQLVLMCYLCNFQLYYNTTGNTRWYFFNQVLNGKIKIPEHKILFFGDSRLETNVDVKQIPGGWTYATGGSSPVEMYFALKRHLKLYPKPDTLIISFSPRTFVQAYSFWGYAVRNDFFSYKDIKEISIENNHCKSDTVIGNFPLFKFLLYKFKYIGYYQSDLNYNHVFLAGKKNRKAIENFQAEKGAWIYPGLKDGCSELNFETSLNDFQPSCLLTAYFEKILQLCQQQGIPVLFLAMPVNESSFKNLNPKFLNDYKSFIKKTGERYPMFFISDEFFSFPDELFGDESHLNQRGKEIYTKYLLNKILKRG